MSDIPVSKKYIHDLKKLYTEHEEKRITDEEFSQRSDELKEREAKSLESMGHILLVRELSDIEKEVADETKKDSQQNEQALAAKNRAEQLEQDRQRQKQLLEQQAEEQKLRREKIKKENERNNYRNEMDNYVNRLEANAQRWQSRYTWLQIILLVFSAGTATMASIEGVPRWMVSLVGLIATIAGGLLTTFKIQDRIYASRKAVVEVKLECQKYDYHIEEYHDTNTEEEAFIKFSRNLNAIQGQEMLQEVELWNPKKEDKSTREEDAQRSLLPRKTVSEENSEEQKSAEDPQGDETEQAKKDST